MHTAPTYEALLSVAQVRLGYPGVEILEGLSFDLQAGQLVFLLGANGAGKSTLLQSLAGIQKPLSGSIQLAGQDITQYQNKEKAQLLSIVFPLRQYPGNMTVYQLVSLGRTPYTGWWGRLDTEDQACIDAALVQCGIKALQYRTLTQLSDGERQKASIARCLAQDTPLLLLDEPSAHLDLHSRLEIMALLRDLAHTQEKLIIVASHALDLALGLADQIALIQRGRRWILDLPEQLVLQDQIALAFPPHENIAFEKASGSFRLKVPTERSLSLTGEGEYAYWTQRALNRSGWEVQVEGTHYPKVFVEAYETNIQWRLATTIDSAVQAFSSLSALLRALDQRI